VHRFRRNREILYCK